MKTFVVILAVVAVASANSINRAAGWGSPGSSIPIPSINIGLGAGAAAVGAGQANSGQALIEAAIGNVEGPAFLQSLSGALAAVEQGELVSQISMVDKPSGASSTLIHADSQNIAVGQDLLMGHLGGSEFSAVLNSGGGSSSGEGSEAVEVSSLIDILEKKN